MMSEESAVLLGLAEMEGFGWESIRQVVEAVPDLGALLMRPARDLLRGRAVDAGKANEIERILTNRYIEGKLSFYEQCGVKPVTFFDSAYPAMLRYIHKPPWVLYTIGDMKLLQQPSVAVVGTRHPTAYGREVAQWFGAELAAAGLTVVSGLARGIDSYAHAGALRASGPTVAVLGNGINVMYPPEHHALQRTIGERGLLVSEYGWNVKPGKWTFPWRNRIIAGLCRGTLVVEAAAQSGSLLTADYANDSGRDVFVVPGLLTSPKSAGVYELYRQGAKLITRPEDIVAELGMVSARSGPGPETDVPNVGTDGSTGGPLPAEEAELLAVLGENSATVDELLERTGHSFGHLHTVLLSLLVKKRIRALPGSSYIARLS